jgi:hypothetical protein
MNTCTEMEMQQVFWWSGKWIRLDRRWKFVDVTKKKYMKNKFGRVDSVGLRTAG